jgi:hypothetical protein
LPGEVALGVSKLLFKVRSLCALLNAFDSSCRCAASTLEVASSPVPRWRR